MVNCELHLRLVLRSELSVPIRALLRYDPADPYAVHVTFHSPDDETARWVFALDLLRQGLHRPAGIGDVRVWPHRRRGQDIVRIALRSGEQGALLEASAHALKSFQRWTEVIVPPGTEHQHIDMDAELSSLLAEM